MKKERINIELYIPKKCNYNCNYCGDFFKQGENIENKLFNPLKLDDLLSKVDAPRKSVYIIGGEPTLYSGLSFACEVFSARGFKDIIITSNMTLKVRQIKELSKYSVKYIASYHKEFAKIDKFLVNTARVNNIDALENIQVMWSSDRAEEILKDYRYIKSLIDVPVFLVPTYPADLMNEQGICNLDNTEFVKFNNWLKEQSGDILTNDFLQTQVAGTDQYKGYHCNYNYSNITMDLDGNIYDCIADLVVGNPTQKWAEDPLICKYDRCICELDSPKWKNI